MPYTSGFAPGKLAQHFSDHGADFGAPSAVHYEAMADAFLGGPMGPATRQCARLGGDILRYNEVTEEFGVLSATGVIRTYYKADPAVHGYPTNLDYFLAECSK